MGFMCACWQFSAKQMKNNVQSIRLPRTLFCYRHGFLLFEPISYIDRSSLYTRCGRPVVATIETAISPCCSSVVIIS